MNPDSSTIGAAASNVALIAVPTEMLRNESEARGGASDERDGELVVTVPEAPTRAGIMEVIGSDSPKLQRCYERELTDHPIPSGKIVFAWRIEPSGRVQRVRVKTSQLGSPRLVRCLVRVIEGMRFPRTRDGATVTFPFFFDGSGL